MKIRLINLSLFAGITLAALLAAFPVVADDDGEGGGGGAGSPMAEIMSGDSYVENGKLLVGGATIGDLPTLFVEIDGVPSSKVAVDANGDYEVDVTGYSDFIDLVPYDINGVGGVFTVELPSSGS